MRYYKSLIFIMVCMFLFTSFIVPNIGKAHMGSTGYSDVSIEGQSIHYDLYLLADLVGGFLQVDKNQDGYMVEAEISQSKPIIEELVFHELSVRNNGVAGDVTVKNIELTERWNFSMFRIDLEYKFDEPVTDYEIDYAVFFDTIDRNHQNFMTVTNGDDTSELVFTADNRVFTGQANHSQSNALSFGDYLVMGMTHIWAGIDHLLFLVGLLIARGSLRNYIKILTAFTVGHSVTLALAALEIVLIPGIIIEPLIALSIVYVAVENIWKKNLKWRWLVSLGFGLVHGFGFAEILSGRLGSDFVMPLLSFNLGVELGQIVVLLVVLPVIIYVAKQKWQPQLVTSVSIAISLMGVYWFFERII